MRRIAWVTAAAVIVYGSVGCSGSDSVPSAATPSFSPAAGTYTAPQVVTLSCATAGATVYYTTDGSSPTTASRAYSGPIAVSITTTIKAIAVASGYTGSAIAIGTYTINLPTQAATPTFAPAPGTYTAQQSVTLNCETAGATIYYTLDGSAPTTSSTVYGGPITVSSTTTIRAVAVASGFTDSGIATGVYVVNCASNKDFAGCYVGDACHWGYEDAYCGWLGRACLACPTECYCSWGLCWHGDTGDPCPAPYAK